MGIFAKQGPYQEFKDLFVKEFDADKTVDRLNKVEDELNANKELIKRSEALDRETGKVDTVMSKYQQGLNTVVNNANASLWDKKNAAKQLATSYVNDPERVALAKSKQALDESIKVNAGKADTSKAAKQAQLIHDYKGGTAVTPEGNISTLQPFSVPKDTDPNTIVSLIGSGFEKQGVSYEKDPVSGVEGYWQTEGKSRIYRRPEDIREVAKATLKADEDTRKHYELVAFDKLHDDYTTLYKQQGLPQLEAERMATGKLYEEQKDASGNPIKGTSILDKAVDSQLNTVAEAAVTKFTTEVTDRKINQFQKVKAEGAGAGTSPTNEIYNVEHPIQETQTEGVPLYDVDNILTKENYKTLNKIKESNNRILQNKDFSSSLKPFVDKYVNAPQDQKNKIFKEALDKIKIISGKDAEKWKTLHDSFRKYINNLDASASINKMDLNFKKSLIDIHGYPAQEVSNMTPERLVEVKEQLNKNRKNVANNVSVPTNNVSKYMADHVANVLSNTSEVNLGGGQNNQQLSKILKDNDFEYITTKGDSEKITDVETLLAHSKISGIAFVPTKDLKTVRLEIVLNVNGKPLHTKPSKDMIDAIKPVTELQLQRVNSLAPKKEISMDLGLGIGERKYIIKEDHGKPKLYDVNSKGFVPNGNFLIDQYINSKLKSQSGNTSEKTTLPYGDDITVKDTK